jgi:hypothetical protein
VHYCDRLLQCQDGEDWQVALATAERRRVRRHRRGFLRVQDAQNEGEGMIQYFNVSFCTTAFMDVNVAVFCINNFQKYCIF